VVGVNKFEGGVFFAALGKVQNICS
jgi:hypothetical protein